MKKFVICLATSVVAMFFSDVVNAQSYLAQPRVTPSVSYLSPILDRYASKIKQTMYILYNGYVDTVNLEKLSDAAIVKMIQELDPHSQYIAAEDVEDTEVPLKGNFGGIGIEYAIINDTLTIQSVIPGGPAEKVALRAGDKINSVDGNVISGSNLTQSRVLKMLRGNLGTKVTIGIIRRGVPIEDITLTREKIPLNTVYSAYEISPGIFYLRLSSFGANTYRELMQPLLAYNGTLKGIILDLRGNGGGYLHTALKIANEFLQRGQLILYSEGRAVKRTNDYADGSGKLKDIPLAILIDENSASASEIVTGAVQDWDRGVVIGRRSFGKGLVQQEYRLGDGSRLRVTIARYHTPSGRVIQSPYEMGKRDEYYENFIKRYTSGERFSADSIKINDSLTFKTLIKGRTVYGGGGIIPDIFIPIDSSYYSKSYLRAVNSGLFYDFVTSYSDSHRAEFNGISYEDFINNFTVSEEYYREFLDRCAGEGILFTEEELDKSGSEIKTNLKGYIIRNIYGIDYYIRWSNLTDPVVLRAIEEVR